MPYPVTQLISESFYTAGIVARDFQTVTGSQSATGLLKLNEILSDTFIDQDMIPYFTSSYNFNFIAGQEMYFIPGMTELETLTFFITTIRYQMRKNPRDQYFGQGRADNVLSLPFNWHPERTLGGTNLFVYFFPDQNYPVTATGLFQLNSVTLNQDLLLTLDQFYINYLQYRLADRLCTVYSFETPPGVRKELLKYEQLISKRSSPLDLTMEKISTMTNKSSINYAQVNLGKGWTT
jgi:hypothetical protein